VIIKLELPVELTEEDGCFIVVCPVFGVGSQGRTKEQALENAKEALELYLEDEDVQKEHEETILDYAVSFILSDKEKKFRSHHHVEEGNKVTNLLDVEIHGKPEVTNPLRA
jgi:predicted RNase H-like HicB family nuclease